MTSYFLRRLLLVIPTFIGITLLVFAITRVVPGGPVERMMTQAAFAQGDQASSRSRSAALRVSTAAWALTVWRR